MRVPFIIPDGGWVVKLDAGWIFRYHGPDDEVMTMQYLCAPMEGQTGDLFRQEQQQTFPAADSYYTLCLSPTANRTFSPRELREIEPAHNAGIRVVPQLMGHCAEDFLWMAGQHAHMGNDEENFNLGCPSNTVTVKKKGAGLILSLLTAVAGAVGLGFCIVNAGTDSFRKIGTSPVVIGCAVIAILALVLRVVLDKKLTIAADAMSVVAGLTLVVAAVQFLSPRVNTIASIMTFTNNAQTMADLSSAIYGTAALLIAVVLNIIAAFTNVNEQ